MKWSQLKVRTEALFSDAVRGRVELRLTCYRKANDDMGRGWITIDKKEIINMCWFIANAADYYEELRLQKLRGYEDVRNIENYNAYLQVRKDAASTRYQKSIYKPQEFESALYEYLQLPIDGILSSPNPIIRGLGMLDRRVGKSRITKYSLVDQPEFVRRLQQFRCEAEGSTWSARLEGVAN